ncbi:GNAT family N-acetyltransferase [Sphingorhabdus sp. Alg231-15]|uniref:GNAT family N-acetyltransferase n=1 Tax=Sphingorhabdus sp. Alg231-15 TaxID=1922222 RepID=UPI000D550ADF
MTTIAIPNDKLAVIVTYFEMQQRPSDAEEPSDLIFSVWDRPDLDEYRKLFRKIGDEWLWFGRLLMSDEELRSILDNDKIEIAKIQHGEEIVGFVELDFSDPGACEIVYFGLVPEMNGKGYGHSLMTETLKRAWKNNIKRVWLHTCTNDSQRAPSFYERAGFTAYKREVDMHDDPRLSGHLPMEAGPHVPVIS